MAVIFRNYQSVNNFIEMAFLWQQPAIIDLTIIDFLRKKYSMANVRTATDYVSSHFVRFFARLICAVKSQRAGETTCGTKGE